MEKPKLYKACFEFTQEGNYNGTKDIEELKELFAKVKNS